MSGVPPESTQPVGVQLPHVDAPEPVPAMVWEKDCVVISSNKLIKIIIFTCLFFEFRAPQDLKSVKDFFSFTRYLFSWGNCAKVI